MADRIRDPEDEKLAQLFASEPIVDDGFSDGIVRRIRRRLWARRLVLPVAAAVGASISFKPLLSLAIGLGSVLKALPISVEPSVAAAWLPSPTMLVTGAVLFAAMLGAIRLLED